MESDVAGGDPFAALPHALALHVFGGVPAEQRLRCAEVCRGWRVPLADATLWIERRTPRVPQRAAARSHCRVRPAACALAVAALHGGRPGSAAD
jgi:hypothetical protein